jgi:hypothetical protein
MTKRGKLKATILQQQNKIFEDYDQLAPFLRQRAKGVPLATNEDRQNQEVSFVIWSYDISMNWFVCVCYIMLNNIWCTILSGVDNAASFGTLSDDKYQYCKRWRA